MKRSLLVLIVALTMLAGSALAQAPPQGRGQGQGRRRRRRTWRRASRAADAHRPGCGHGQRDRHCS